MSAFSRIEPGVGSWYWSYGEVFEVVAVDGDSGTVEIQYADGTLAELDYEEWALRSQAGSLHPADPPGDASGAIGGEDEEDLGERPRELRGRYDGELSLRASGLDSLDLFD